MVELRPHQEKTLDRLRDAFRAGHRCVMLYAPTGAGKTEMAISLMDATARKFNRAAMVLDRVMLCDQTSKRLEKYSIDHGVLQAGHWRYRPAEKIQVCSAQTLEARGSFPPCDLVIIDEAHSQRSDTTEFARKSDVRVIGLSASPFTAGLGNTYTAVVSATTTKELVDQGWLTPLRVFVAQEIDMEGAKKVAGEWSQKEATERGIKITGDVVAEWVKKTHEVFGGPRKTIVFSAGVAHGADLSAKFAEAGYNFVSISYNDDDEFKRQVVEDFSRPDTTIHGLIATDILTKGFDVSDVMIGVSARPFSRSFSSHVQQMGRVMRSHPGKEFAVWLCMARGSNVLTDRGLVPIEKVSLSDKIWDGTNFVSHKGAVCNGIQKTITYQGLTATPGHLVHTAQGWRTFGDCAREQIAITQTGIGGSPVRIGEDNFAGCSVARGKATQVHSRNLRMRDVWLSLRDFIVELGNWANERLSRLQPARTGISELALCASAGNAGTLQKPEGCQLPALWGAWCGVQIRGRKSRDALDHAKPWHSRKPGSNATGSNQSSGKLRAGEYSLAYDFTQSTEQARQSGCCSDAQIQAGTSRDSLFGQHSKAVFLDGDDGRTGCGEMEPAFIETEREVWDILDAGPNNRFTCEGLLVHNCHSGNYLRFRDQWDALYMDGVTELRDDAEKPKKEPSKAEKERAKCPKCGSLWAGGDMCPHCGHVRVRINEVVSLPGELAEIEGAPKEKYDSATKERWFQEMLGYARTKGYKDGWAFHKYVEKFGVQPSWKKVGKPCGPEVAGWIKSRQIAFAHARKAA